MNISPEIARNEQGTENTGHLPDLPKSGVPERVVFSDLSSLTLAEEGAKMTSAGVHGACLAFDHPTVLLFGALIAACGFGLLVYGFMS